ncbi:type II toxin-antitoxin system HicA family toxin [Sphingomonas ginsenosidivorax]|uniref:type II toxin-antitoxin system HicA family toxin n=1 Tax=Sphingomonas ginsenosidivorax TaxID=862135 RepID=UPI001F550AD9|nr:type II toxin-antitoxin system HicA family toxin [Sphingomonas ginsenosidivorax]
MANPKAAISFADFERLLDATGFEHVRTKGSHRQYAHPKVPGIFTVLPHGKAIKAYLARRFLELLDEHGLHIDS